MSDTKTALVTGALGGLGTAIVERLLADGHRVVACDRRRDEEGNWGKQFAAAVETQALRVYELDVTKEESVSDLASKLDTDGVQIDYLINNAGVAGAGDPDSMAAKTFDIVMRVNLSGTFLCSRAFCGPMMARGFGRIVNLASLYAYDPGPGQAPYAAAKAAIVGYTHSLAKDLGPHGITCNVIAPGLIWHERLQGVLADSEYAAIREATPLRRAGEPREIAGTVAFLLSADASYINGQTIHVNGGIYMTG